MKYQRNLFGVFAASLLALTVGTPAHATGGETGGGGYHSCAEYSDLAGKIATTMLTIGQAEFSKVNVVIQVQDIWKIIQTPLKCVPVEQLDRDAISYPDQVETDLLWGAWDKMTMPDKIRLTLHELAVLAKYEGDGQYYVSRDAQTVLEAQSQFFKDYSRAEQVVHNPDGTTSYSNPFIRDNAGHAWYIGFFEPTSAHVNGASQYAASDGGLADGICKFFSQSSIQQAELFGSRTIDFTISNLRSPFAGVEVMVAQLADDGHFLGMASSEDGRALFHYMTEVTCRNNN